MKKCKHTKITVIFALSLLFCILSFCFFGCGIGEDAGSAEYDEDALFKFGLVPVMKDKKWGYMDSEGGLVIPLVYDEAYEFDENGMAKVKVGEDEFYIDTAGEKRDYTPPEKKERELPNKKENHSGYTVFSQNDKDGLKDDEGNIILEAVYDMISDVIEDRSYVIIINDDKFGFFDLETMLLAEPIYEDFYGIYESGLALVHLGKEWFFIDRSGQRVSDLVFEDARHCNPKIMSVKLNGKWGYVDQCGKYIAEPVFDEVQSFADNGIAAVKSEGKWGFIDMKGSFVIEPSFEKANSFGKFDLAPVCVKGKFGYIDLSGSFVIEPQFKYAYPFGNTGYANVYDHIPYEGIGNEGAIIDRSGKRLCSYDYDMFSYYGDGYIICRRESGREFSLITADGREITSSREFDAVLEFFRYLF